MSERGNKSRSRERIAGAASRLCGALRRWTAAALRRAKDQNRVICKSFERCIRARKRVIIRRETAADAVVSSAVIKGCLHVQHVINRGKMKNTSGDYFIALSKSIQITVINDPIYTFREARFNLMIELESVYLVSGSKYLKVAPDFLSAATRGLKYYFSYLRPGGRARTPVSRHAIFK